MITLFTYLLLLIIGFILFQIIRIFHYKLKIQTNSLIGCISAIIIFIIFLILIFIMYIYGSITLLNIIDKFIYI